MKGWHHQNHIAPSLLGMSLAVIAISACEPIPKKAVVCLVDCSRSSERYLPRSRELILGVARSLDDSQDLIEVLRLTHDVYPIYDAGRPTSPDISRVFKEYSGWRPRDARGTAYGTGLRHVLKRCNELQRQGYQTTALVFGDGKNEPVRGLGSNWQASSAQLWPPPSSNHHRLAFIFVDPEDIQAFRPLLDRFPRARRRFLSPVDALDRMATQKLEELIF